MAVSACLIGGLLTAAGVAPVTAQRPDVPPPREYGESGTTTGPVTVRARSEWLPVGSEGSGSTSSCTTRSVQIVVEDDFLQPVNRQWRQFGADGSIPFAASPDDLPSSLPTNMRQFSPTGRWYGVSCDGDITIVAEGGPAVTVAGLMQEALDQVDPPEPELAVTPAEVHFAQLQSWLAIAPTYWDVDRRATAAAGRVVVTAVVTPVDSVWNMGDGETVDCEGPGTVWEPGLDEGSATCPYTYRRSSAGEAGDAFQLEATVRFEVTVETNAPGTYGPFEDLERSVVEDVQVGEIQAVND
ncbi:MAG: hypothetical protein AAF531_10200 [Actinomycetota bacterium]